MSKIMGIIGPEESVEERIQQRAPNRFSTDACLMKGLTALARKGVDGVGIGVGGKDGIATLHSMGNVDMLKRRTKMHGMPMGCVRFGHVFQRAEGSLADGARPRSVDLPVQGEHTRRALFVSSTTQEDVLHACERMIGMCFENQSFHSLAHLLFKALTSGESRARWLSQSDATILLFLSDAPDRLYAIRCSSQPLWAAHDHERGYVASDPIAFPSGLLEQAPLPMRSVMCMFAGGSSVLVT